MLENCGIVFGATGKSYQSLARRAARNLRQVMPQIPIDLFTDTLVDDPIFSQVHLVEINGPRPKMEALRRSRFERTLYLDCDAVVVNDVSDIFEILRRADIVGAHEQFGSSPVSMQVVGGIIPAGFRQINSGVLGIRKSPETTAFLQRWQDEFIAKKLMYDQPLLRWMLWESDLKVTILPMEYNQMFYPFIRVSSPLMMAPRVLHLTQLHESDAHCEPVDEPFNLALLLPAPVRDKFNDLLKSDRTLGAVPNSRVLVGEMLRKMPFVYRVIRKIRRLFR